MVQPVSALAQPTHLIIQPVSDERPSAQFLLVLVPVAAARKIGVPDGRVAEWEAGTATPSIAQLRKVADVYKRPLGVFFLPEPPAQAAGWRGH